MEVAAAATVATVVSSLYYTKRSADIQKKQVKKANAAAQKQYELEREKTQLTLADEQRKNRSLLAQQQSTYKAKLGAGGLSQPGSGQVVLDNMQREHDMDDKYLTSQANISLEALLNGINQTKSHNLLSLRSSTNKAYARMTNDVISGTGTVARSMIK